MFNIGLQELLVILVIVLIFYGPGKLPQIGSALGKGIAEFKKAARSLDDDPEPKPRIPGGSPSPDSEKTQGQNPQV